MKDKSELIRALLEDDREKELFLTKNMNPYVVRDTYGKELGDLVHNEFGVTKPRLITRSSDPDTVNWEKMKELFEKKDSLKDTTVKEVNNLQKNLAEFDPAKNQVSVLKNVNKPMQIADTLHDFKHATEYNAKRTPNDIALLLDSNKGDQIRDTLQNSRGYTNLKGLSKAEDFFQNHHINDSIFEREGLTRLLKGKKLSTLLPLLKATGIGALGYQAMGIGNKAMAGELGEAALDTADMATDYIPSVGQVKDAIRPTEMGQAELPPEEMVKREKFNKTKQRLLNK